MPLTPMFCIALAVYHEARSEPLAAQTAVAEVVLRRTRDKRWPNSVCSVVFQDKQFSWTALPPEKLVPKEEEAFDKAYSVARHAFLTDDGRGAVTECADHFLSYRDKRPSWVKAMKVEIKIGTTTFYCENR